MQLIKKSCRVIQGDYLEGNLYFKYSAFVFALSTGEVNDIEWIYCKCEDENEKYVEITPYWLEVLKLDVIRKAEESFEQFDFNSTEEYEL